MEFRREGSCKARWNSASRSGTAARVLLRVNSNMTLVGIVRLSASEGQG